MYRYEVKNCICLFSKVFSYLFQYEKEDNFFLYAYTNELTDLLLVQKVLKF